MSSFRFRKKTEYGMIMMSILAREGRGKLVSVRRMQEYGLPRSFLVKIAKELIQSGLVVAKEGRGGGYSLIKDPEMLTLKEVIEAVEGQVSTASCLVHGSKKCPIAAKCPHRQMMRVLNEEIGAVLSKYKLAEFGN